MITKSPFLFSDDQLLLLSENELFTSNQPAQSNVAEGGNLADEIDPELSGRWDSLQRLSLRVSREMVDPKAGEFDIEQLNVNRLISLIDVSATWLLFIASSGEELDEVFVKERLLTIDALIVDVKEWLA